MLTKLKKHTRRIFLIDSIGALTTALLLGVVLPVFQKYIGMPLKVLYMLALIAVGFLIYSFTCYVLNPKNWRPFLQLIALANISYCFLSTILIILYYDELSLMGFMYFIGEICLVMIIGLIEMKLASRNNSTR